jgi:hypothetical protein
VNSSAGRWILKIDVLVAHFSEFLQMEDIQQVAVQFNRVTEVSARGFNSSFHIFKDLLDLRAEIIIADDVAGLVQGNLARDEYDLPTGYRGNLGIAGGFLRGFRNQSLKVVFA